MSPINNISDTTHIDIDTLEQLADEARARRIEQIHECERIIRAELSKLLLPGLAP